MITTEQIVAAKTEKRFRGDKPYKEGDWILAYHDDKEKSRLLCVKILYTINKGGAYKVSHHQGARWKQFLISWTEVVGLFLKD